MKKSVISLSAAFAIAVAGAGFSAFAQEAGPEQRTSEQGERTEQARTDRERASERFCIQQTGSRIVANRNARSETERADCVAQGGRVYTREEIERTGSTDVAEALRQLDPRIF